MVFLRLQMFINRGFDRKLELLGCTIMSVLVAFKAFWLCSSVNR